MKVKPVKTIQIAGVNVKIIYREMEDFGRFYPDEKEIHLNKNCLKDKELHDLTLAHEICHAWLRITGLFWSLLKENDNLEEGLVRNFEQILFPVLRKVFL